MQEIMNNWKKHAEKNEDRNFKFLTKLKHRGNQKKVDKTTKALHDEAFSKIDCLQCSNCCKTSTAQITKKDLTRISAHLKLTEEEFTDQYLEKDPFDQLIIAGLPCPFLGEDNACAIYEVRPKDCEEFPHTYKPEFSSRRYMHSANTVDCPAVFYIVERLRRIM